MADTYTEIIRFIENYGEVLTEHVGNENTIRSDEKSLSDMEIHERDMNWLESSDLIVADVSIPSLGVGYEIASALNRNIPVLCLYNTISDSRLSAMISGIKNLPIIRYQNTAEAIDGIKKYLKDFQSKYFD